MTTLHLDVLQSLGLESDYFKMCFFFLSGLPGNDAARLINIRRRTDSTEDLRISVDNAQQPPTCQLQPVTSQPSQPHADSWPEIHRLYTHQLQHWWAQYCRHLQCGPQGMVDESRGLFQSPQPSIHRATTEDEAQPHPTPPPPPPRPPRPPNPGRQHRSHRHRNSSDTQIEQSNQRPHSQRRSRTRHRRQRPSRHLMGLTRPFPLTYLQFMSGVTSVLPLQEGVLASDLPPPYMPAVLPPYLEVDPAPSYRSRDTSSSVDSLEDRAT